LRRLILKSTGPSSTGRMDVVPMSHDLDFKGRDRQNNHLEQSVHCQWTLFWKSTPQDHYSRKLSRHKCNYWQHEEETKQCGYYLHLSQSSTATFNIHVSLLIDSLSARGKSTQDLLINLFKGYQAAMDKTFIEYILEGNLNNTKKEKS
jgi:hypothetical protein